MSHRIRLSPRLAPLFGSKRRILLADEQLTICEEDPLVAQVLEAALIPRHILEFEELLAPQATSSQVRQIIDSLIAQRLLAPASDSQPTTQDCYWDSLNCKVPKAVIAFQSLCATSQDQIGSALLSNGFLLDATADFLLVATDDYLRPELAAFANRQRPWLLAKPLGHTPFLGPIFIPGETACCSCMALWMKPHRWEQMAFVDADDDFFPPQPSFAATPASLAIAANLIAAAAAVWVATGRHPELEGAILSLDTRSLKLHRSSVRRHPECKNCGPTQLRPVRGPLRHFLSPLTGLVSGIRLTDRPVCGFYHAVGYFSAPLPKLGVRRYLRPQHSVGKGRTPEEAETVCIAESIERYSVLFRGNEHRVRARMSELDAVDPNRIMLYSQAQYQRRAEWNASHAEKQYVPHPFDPDEEVEWTQVRSLRTGLPRYIPTALCYMYYDFACRRPFYGSDANGCAAGQTETQASLSALLELIERDSVGIWWYNRIRRPALNLESLDDPRILQAEHAFRENGRKLYVLDIATDMGVPSCLAIAPMFDGSQPCFGAASSLSYRQAAFKAISEAAQVSFWASTGNGPDDLLDWLRDTSVKSCPHLQPLGESTPNQQSAMTSLDSLGTVLDRLAAHGLEAYHLDLTRPEINLPVARIFAPDLRHFWARFAPGRLYQVPVRMGWLQTALAEDELNPIPCMI